MALPFRNYFFKVRRQNTLSLHEVHPLTLPPNMSLGLTDIFMPAFI